MQIVATRRGLGWCGVVLAASLVGGVAQAEHAAVPGSFSPTQRLWNGSEGAAFPALLGDSQLHYRHEHESERFHTEFRLDRKLLTGGPGDIYGRDFRGSGLERTYLASGIFDLLSGSAPLGDRPFSLAAYGTYRWQESFQQPLGLEADAEEQKPAFGLRGQLGGLVLSAEHGRTFGVRQDEGPFREEATAHTMLSAYLPVQSVIGSRASGAWWLPNLSYSLTQLEGQRLERRLGGPDAVQEWSVDQTVHFLGADWSGSRWSVAYGLTRSDSADALDGTGAPSDYQYGSHDVTVSLWPTEALMVYLWSGRSQEGFANAGGRATLGASVGFDWRFRPEWTLSASVSPYREQDDAARSKLDTHTTAVQVERQLTQGIALGPNRKTGPARAMVRASHSQSAWRERLHGKQVRDTNWTLGVGVVVDFF